MLRKKRGSYRVLVEKRPLERPRRTLNGDSTYVTDYSCTKN
jgi:hypothetical protein